MFLENERKDESGIIPKYFETNFGVEDIEQDKSLSQKSSLMFEDIELRGKIDRIDINKTSKLFEVVDYKSGSKTITKKEIEDGLSLQLPIYVWAAKSLLLNNLNDNFDAEAMTIYTLNYKGDKFGKNRVSLSRSKSANQSELIDKYVDIALEHVKNSVKNIRKGNFPLTKFMENTEKICKFCNYKMICRIDAIKK
jgi:ATP-dependent helicase/DNAse subunit B